VIDNFFSLNLSYDVASMGKSWSYSNFVVGVLMSFCLLIYMHVFIVCDLVSFKSIKASIQ